MATMCLEVCTSECCHSQGLDLILVLRILGSSFCHHRVGALIMVAGTLALNSVAPTQSLGFYNASTEPRMMNWEG